MKVVYTMPHPYTEAIVYFFFYSTLHSGVKKTRDGQGIVYNALSIPGLTFTFISFLSSLHTFWHAIPTSLYILNVFFFIYFFTLVVKVMSCSVCVVFCMSCFVFLHTYISG